MNTVSDRRYATGALTTLIIASKLPTKNVGNISKHHALSLVIAKRVSTVVIAMIFAEDHLLIRHCEERFLRRGNPGKNIK